MAYVAGAFPSRLLGDALRRYGNRTEHIDFTYRRNILQPYSTMALGEEGETERGIAVRQEKDIESQGFPNFSIL